MLLISGMHRSGTSLVARLFFEAGADMGKKDTFYKPDKWNPDGYFEQTDIHAVNMPLLHGPFGKFSYFFLPSTQTILRRSGKFKKQIETLSRQYQGKVVKENRFCITLPAWRKCHAKVDKLIICLRDPVQVACSLKKRNLAGTSHAFYLWYTHNIRLLENTEDIPRWFVYYGNILNPESGVNEIDHMFRFFDCGLPENELNDLYARCVKPEMNHYPEEKVRYPKKIEHLWQELMKRHKDQFKTDK